MDITLLANRLLGFGVILADIGVFAALVYFAFFRNVRHAIIHALENRGMMLAGIVALVSTLGSLFYSQIAGFAPCDLCWFQRIFMYPLVIILGIAVWKKDRRIVDYALPIAGIGFLVSLYQNYLYYFNQGLDATCLLGSSGGVSCVKRYVFEFGYVTIPVMALTAFAMIIILLVFQKMGEKRLKKA